MKAIAAAILFLATATAHCGVAGFLTKEARTWKFIESVGGMKVTLRGNTLAVDCDVSGLRKVTVKPTLINSGIGVRELRHKLVGKTIRLSLVTSVIEKGISTTCKPLDLSAYPTGEYDVEYVDPDGSTHSLGTIKLTKPKSEKPSGRD